MLKAMTSCRLVLAGILAMLTCFGRAAEQLKIGMVAPVTGPAAESGLYQIRVPSSLSRRLKRWVGVVSRPIELFIEGNQATSPGTVPAFNFLGACPTFLLLPSVRNARFRRFSSFLIPPNLAC